MKHTWNKTQNKALKSCISHYERMRDNKRRLSFGYKRLLEAPELRDCACCKKYNEKDSEDLNCKRCPISIVSGKRYCRNTPYHNAEITFSLHGVDSPEFKNAAQIQINFMNKVLKAGIPVNKD